MKTSSHALRIVVFVLAVIMCFPFNSPCSAKLLLQDSQVTAITDTSKAANIPVDLHSTHIFLDVMVNGKGPYTFALDTGAPVSVVDSRIAAETKLKLAGEIPVGGTGEETRTANLAIDVNLEMPGVVLAKQQIVSLSLEELEPVSGHKIDGIIGINLFESFVVEIDYAMSRLRVYSNDGFRFDGGGQVIPLTIESRVCLAKAKVKFPGKEPVEGNFKIDTGSNSMARLNGPFVAQHQLAKDLVNSIESKGFGVGGESRVTYTRIESFQIGGLNLNNPVILLSQAKRGAGANSNVAGIVGGGLLQRCNVIFDFSRERMILRPGLNYDAPFESDMLGIRWKTGGRGNLKSFVVSGVREDSAAFKAGFKEGDELVEINGVDPDQLSIPYLHQLARKHNHVVRLTVKRGGKTIKQEIKLVRVL